MAVIELTPQDPRWQAFVDHLNACGQAKWVLEEDGSPKQDELYFLGVWLEEQVIGNLTLIKRPIVIPPSEWAGERDRVLRDDSSQPVTETFVQTFFVEVAHRKQGHGAALQRAALNKTRELGCYQMRSWSSLDKNANYRLKFKLGFGFHPEIQVAASGLAVSGGYFIRVVNPI